MSRSNPGATFSILYGACLLRIAVIGFILLYLMPIAISAALYAVRSGGTDWRVADKSSTGLLAPAASHPAAVVRVFSARTVSWRGIIASHSWIVVKPAGGSAYRRFDYTAWGVPIWVDRVVPDGRWFGSAPEIVFAADGEDAERMIPRIMAAVKSYRYAKIGDYTLWPGPNSNTFVAR